MKKLVLIVLCVVMLVMLCACNNKDNTYKQEQDSMFTVLEKGFNYVVFQQKDTGVVYIRGSSSSITVLVNPDGTPYTGR